MTLHTPQRRGHVAHLLPAYVNESLDRRRRERTHAHLAGCAACRAELADWEALRGATRTAVMADLAPAPDSALMGRVWAQIDAAAVPAPRRRVGLRQVASLGQLALGQIPLLPKGIWAVSAAVVVAGFLGVALVNSGADVAAYSLLGLVVPLVTGAGVALTYGPEHDPGLEVALATPTSPRLVLVSRLALVFGYNFGLALGVTLLLTLLRGIDFALLAAVWVGPMLLLAGLSLLITVSISSAASLASVAAIGCLRFFAAAFGTVGGPLSVAPSGHAAWQTNPLVLVIALAMLGAAVLYVPRRERLA
jgi:hypothetical protein